MKLSIFILPLEVWMDILLYPWINRLKMAQMVDKFGNRKFAEILQFFLHDYRKITLQELYFSDKEYCLTSDEIVANDPYQSCLVAERMNFQPCEIAQVPMTSEKIVNFKLVQIDCFDGQVLKFLNNMKPLFNNVILDLKVQNRMENLRTVLGFIFPLMNSIRAICCNLQNFTTMEYFFRDAFAEVDILSINAFLSAKASFRDPFFVKKVKKFPKMGSELIFSPFFDEEEKNPFDVDISSTLSIFGVVKWLTAPKRGCHTPKLCIFKGSGKSCTQFSRRDMLEGNEQILKEIRRNFLFATVASTFAVIIEKEETLDEFEVTNDIGEQLSGNNNAVNGRDSFLIMRHQPAAGNELRNWLNENADYTWKRVGNEQIKCGTVKLVNPTIGYIEEMFSDDDAGPSTSAKRMRIG